MWLRADRQTAGRGRLGRSWVSPPGNLHASTLVRLAPGDPPPQTLALVAGIALHEALSAFADGLALKWPNDLLAGDAKLAGILLERHGDAIVAGFGVNLAHHPDLPDRPATSVAALAGPVAPDPTTVCETLAEAFLRGLRRWRSERLAVVVADWEARAHPRGAALRVTRSDGGAETGLFDGLDDIGALRLRLADGGVRVIHAADVSLIRT